MGAAAAGGAPRRVSLERRASEALASRLGVQQSWRDLGGGAGDVHGEAWSPPTRTL